MSAELLASATEAAFAIDVSSRGGAFKAAVQRFVTILKSVPDYAPAEISKDDAGAMVLMAESVISRIEARLSASDDGQDLQVDIAEGVYDIRAALEQIYIWRKHFDR